LRRLGHFWQAAVFSEASEGWAMLQRATDDGIPARPDRDGAPQAEPATARALWPTFMRRTLSEEALRATPEPPPGK
jgi:hypothetical protein